MPFSLFFLGLFATLLLNAINPAARIKDAQKIPYISPKPIFEVTPTPEVKKPSVSLVPSKTTVKYTVSPTPATSGQMSLFIEVGGFENKKVVPMNQYHTLTIVNQSTGATQTDTRQGTPLTFSNLTPGAYRITASPISGYNITSYQCYDCTLSGGYEEGYTDNNYTVNVNVAQGKTNGVFFVYHQ